LHVDKAALENVSGWRERFNKMPLTEKYRKMHRRQRRQRKLRKLKILLAETKDFAKRRVLEIKIKKLQPWWEPEGATD
jgi:hypothetical protein